MEKNSKAEMNQLPPGFRFHPSDEELIVHYLRKKATKTPLPASIVADVELYKLNPWDLPKKSLFGDEEWYFFTPRDRKYPNGLRPNRKAASGYWKATGIDKPILTSCGLKVIGVKKALVFYIGRPPKGNKTDWIMQEYRLPESSDHLPSWSNKKHNSMRLDEWVLCRVRQKAGSGMPFGNIQENRKLDHKDNYVYQELADCPPLIPFLFGNNNNNSDHQDFPCPTETAVSCISFEFVDSNIINKASSSSVCEVENNCNLRKRKLQEQGGLIINGREDCNNNDEKKKVMNNGDCYQQLITVDRSSENDYCGEDDHVSGMMMMISSDQELELELELAQNNYVDQSMMDQDLFYIHSFT